MATTTHLRLRTYLFSPRTSILFCEINLCCFAQRKRRQRCSFALANGRRDQTTCSNLVRRRASASQNNKAEWRGYNNLSVSNQTPERTAVRSKLASSATSPAEPSQFSVVYLCFLKNKPRCPRLTSTNMSTTTSTRRSW